MKLGLLLPHFGAHAHRELLLTGARRAEELGFDSLWVRDHISFLPHGEFESPDPTFLEAFTTLTAVGTVTSRIGLGTGALIPFRHPLVTAQLATAVTWLVGDRLIVGIGSGNSDREFAGVGLEGVDRGELALENVAVLRAIWSGADVDHDGAAYRFHDICQLPVPAGTIPIWYCGTTPASVRRAAAACDGWMPGRIGLDTLCRRVEQLRHLSEERSRPLPTVGIIPSTSIAARRGEALASVNVEGLLAWANHAPLWVKPAHGSFERLDDLAGVLLAGTPADVVEGCQQLAASGVEHLVFDCRMGFERWSEQLELLGAEVLPHLGGPLASQGSR